MANRKKLKEVPLGEITAVVCTYARPGNAWACVRRLLKLKLPEVIVWNYGAEPVSNATVNINLSDNNGLIDKPYANLPTSKSYVLMVDDDFLLTSDGLTSLRFWAKRFPAVAQMGYVFEPPFNDFRSKTNYISIKAEFPTEVDLALPAAGMLMPVSLYKKLTGHWAWGSRMVIRPGLMGTELQISCAVWDLSGTRPVVVPVNGLGALRMIGETPTNPWCSQKITTKDRLKMLQWLRSNGWKMLKENLK